MEKSVPKTCPCQSALAKLAPGNAHTQVPQHAQLDILSNVGYVAFCRGGDATKMYLSGALTKKDCSKILHKRDENNYIFSQQPLSIEPPSNALIFASRTLQQLTKI